MDIADADEAVVRCAWVGSDPLMRAYHDEEWGRPVHDDRMHFEMLTLEGAQAGLSWMTILRKREGYRAAFANFDPATVAAYGESDEARLMADSDIVRNRAKIAATIGNARALTQIQAEFGSFDAYIWGWTEGISVRDPARSMENLPVTTALSDLISKDLLRREFKFVGSTIIYSYLQAVGIVDDHAVGCFRWRSG